MTSVVFFSMLQQGHLRRLLPLVSGLASRDVTAHVFTDGRFGQAVRQAGGRCVDMIGRYPVDAADSGSFPIAMRSIAYAAAYAGDIARDVAALGPALVVHDSFAVIGRVVARALGLPRVNVCAGHNVDPRRFQEILAGDPRVVVSPACRAAVATLRERHGEHDASPYCYVAGNSPSLNVYCEPPEFLTVAERAAFEPLAFFGSLPSMEEVEARRQGPQAAGWPAGTALRVYVSFGTTAWRSYPAATLGALEAIASAVARLPHARAVISLGGAEFDVAAIERLARPNVDVEPFVDQWGLLQGADLFITHHGLNSTHEAVFHGVPMLSYPFFWDQPALAARCQEMGLALPLSSAPRAALTEADVLAAFERVARESDSLRARLAVARGYELAVMAGRDAVIDRILALAASPTPH